MSEYSSRPRGTQLADDGFSSPTSFPGWPQSFPPMACRIFLAEERPESRECPEELARATPVPIASCAAKVDAGVMMLSGAYPQFAPRTTPLVGAVFSQTDVSEHQLQRCSFHDMSNEVAMGRCNGVLRKKVNGRADLGCFLPHRREVVARKSALPKQEANSFLNRAEFQHVRVEPAKSRFFQWCVAIESTSIARATGRCDG
jgi:hypothetical protein